MKYAVFVNKGENDFNRIRKRINIGDNIQSMAVKRLFEYAHIAKENIMEIPYFGAEKVMKPCNLIIQGHFSRQTNMAFMHNPYINPIFIGFALMDSILLPEEIEYFKKYEPILCRDEFTQKIFERYQIEAYICGCLTLTLDRRQKEPSNGFYFFVDVKDEFIKKIPEHVKKKAIFLTQNIEIDKADEQTMEYGEKIAYKRVNEYRDSAKMIITSKLHCMCPCVAMGIPTLAVGNNFSYRYSFIDAFVPMLDEKNFEDYGWDSRIGINELEGMKSQLLEIGVSMLAGEPNREKIFKVHEFYLKRKRWNYCKGIKEKISVLFGKKKNPEFILWGASAGGNTVYSCIKELYPESKMIAIVDKYAKGKWEGHFIEEPIATIEKNPDAIVIISTLSGWKEADALLKSMGKKKGIMYDLIHESA